MTLSALVVLSLAVFWGILNLELVLAQLGMPGISIPGVWKFGLSVLEMVIVSQLMIRRFKMSGEMGFVLLRSKHGLQIINRLSKNQQLWKFFSDAGTTVAYGLSSVFIMRKNTSIGSVFAGLIILAVLMTFIAPNVFPFLRDVLDIGLVEKTSEQISPVSGGLFSVIALALLLVGGLFIILFSSIVLYGLVILSALASTLISGTTAIADTAPGGTFLLPGINLPFFEGIAALVIILAVHEVAHAILSRIAKVPVLSSGIVLFGIIPIGAFVEPDEKKLAKTEKVAQTRVLIAGSTSNLMFSIIFFFLFLGYSMLLNEVDLSAIPYASGAAYFIYLVLGMAFALNFIVGTVNLLPLPLFDGYRALDINVDNKHIMKGIMIITLVAFLANFLPWLFAA